MTTNYETRLQMALREVTDELCDLLQKKNANYGRNLPRHGLRGIIVRMGDKIQRLENLVFKSHGDRVGESIWDTMGDLAGYAIMAMALRRIDDLEDDGDWDTIPERIKPRPTAGESDLDLCRRHITPLMHPPSHPYKPALSVPANVSNIFPPSCLNAGSSARS